MSYFEYWEYLSFMVKVNSLQLLNVYVLWFIINEKLHICCLVLIIGSVEVGPDIDMKFHQEVMEIVSYDNGAQ